MLAPAFFEGSVSFAHGGWQSMSLHRPAGPVTDGGTGAYLCIMRFTFLFAAAAASLLAIAFRGPFMSGSDKKVVPLPVGTNPGGAGAGTPLKPAPGHQLAAFAQGCFWGTEYRFRQVPGVVATAVGYAGGSTAKPTYESIGNHAETVLIEGKSYRMKDRIEEP